MDPQALISRDAGLLSVGHGLLWAAFAAYCLAALMYVLHLVAPGKRGFMLRATVSLIGAAAFQTAAMVLRTVVVDRAPFQTLYESLAWFAWSAVVAYLVIE